MSLCISAHWRICSPIIEGRPDFLWTIVMMMGHCLKKKSDCGTSLVWSLTGNCGRMPQGRAGRSWRGWCPGPRAWAGSSWASPASPWNSSPGDGWSSLVHPDHLCLKTKSLSFFLGKVGILKGSQYVVVIYYLLCPQSPAPPPLSLCTSWPLLSLLSPSRCHRQLIFWTAAGPENHNTI